MLLTEYNPWAMAVGSDTPTFALYADGAVIYWHGDRRSGQYLTARFPSSQVAQLLSAARPNDAEGFKACYSIEEDTDQPTNVLIVKTGQGYKTIEVYGAIRNLGNLPPSSLPTGLQTAFHTLLAFDTAESRTWQPPYFEVIIWPFTYAKSSAKWPANFPGLSDKNTQATRTGFQLYLPIADLNLYEAFVGKMKPTQAILLDGRKWTASARFPFPHEAAVGRH